MCDRYGIGLVPYSPVANGLLTGKYRRGQPAPEGTRLAARPNALTDTPFDKLEAIEAFARERGMSMVEVALGGLLAQPVVASVLVGETSAEQARLNAAAADIEFSQSDLAELGERTSA